NDSALLASYTVSRTTDDASDFDEQPANPYDLRAKRALSRHHVGQRFVLCALLEIGKEEEEKDKSAQGGSKEGESLPHELLRNIEVAPIVTISSGRPVNALTGADESLGSAFPLERVRELRSPGKLVGWQPYEKFPTTSGMSLKSSFHLIRRVNVADATQPMIAPCSTASVSFSAAARLGARCPKSRAPGQLVTGVVGSGATPKSWKTLGAWACVT